MKETELNKKNKKLLFNLVSNHFALRKDSLELFKEYLYNPKIDPFYQKILEENNAEDYRAYFDIRDDERESIDAGWILFKKHFNEFYWHFGITYKEFSEGYVKKDKNIYKLYKAVRDFYNDKRRLLENRFTSLDDDLAYNTILKDKFEDIGASKLPKKNIKLVFSMNFVDWFLSASGESWSSCLNLESEHEGAYWACLPGAITDKNRGLIYLTNESSKKIYNIEVPKTIFRSWTLINNHDSIYYLKIYPKKLINASEITIGSEMIHPLHDCSFFESKYSLEEIIYNEYDEGLFPYLDNAEFDGSLKIVSNEFSTGGIILFDKDGAVSKDDTEYTFIGGLSHLILKNKKITEFHQNNLYDCAGCGESYSFSELTEINGFYYCQFCEEDIFVCEECGGTFTINDLHSFEDIDVCSDCIKELTSSEFVMRSATNE